MNSHNQQFWLIQQGKEFDFSQIIATKLIARIV